MNLNFKRHTIITLVGPSECGKSTIAHEIQSQLGGESMCAIVSSDDIRRELLGENLHKHDPRMMPVSTQAFNLLEARVRSLSSYPVNKPFIIVDSTGLSDSFRKEIRSIANENEYLNDVIVFDFKNKDDYYLHSTESGKWIVDKHVKRLRTKVMRELKRKDFNQVILIKKREGIFVFEKDSPKENNWTYNKFCIIGDVHGCYDEMISLLEKVGFVIEDNVIKNQAELDTNIIFIGDLIDKGPKSKEVLEFVRLNSLNFILGNHENFVKKYLDGEMKDFDVSSYIHNFDSVEKYKDDDSFSKLLDFLIRYYSRDYVETDHFILTHAPCKKKYLGKNSKYALKAQRNFRHSQYKDHDELREALSFLAEEDNSCYPYHVFGHIEFENAVKGRKFIALDTGCVTGGRLTAAMFDERGFHRFVSVDSTHPKPKEHLVWRKPQTYQDLSYAEKRNVDMFMRNQVNYISGTMCPGDKVEDELESMEEIFAYYADKDVDMVVVQPKFMGSRAQVYLFPEVENCYIITRNGYKPNIDLTDEYQRLIDKLYKRERFSDAKLIVLDAELMPWSALGERLIENSFNKYIELVKKENTMRELTGFSELKVELPYIEDFKNLNKEEFIDKHGHHAYKTHQLYLRFSNVFDYNKDREDEGISKFSEQIILHGKDAEPTIEPFDILKVVFDDKEDLWHEKSNEGKFITVSDKRCFTLNPSNYTEDSVNTIKNFIKENQLEGVVVKPEYCSTNMAPYRKWRNSDYLHIVYGYDYQHESKYEKLINNKRIDRKLKKSIDDYRNAVDLLHIPYFDYENENKKDILSRFVKSERFAEGIDPRL